MKREINYEKKNHEELEQLNIWFIVNTIFTILTGVATLGLAILSYLK